MFNISQSKLLVHKPGLSALDQLIVCLACGADQVKPIKQIKEIALKCGVRGAKKWNISDKLRSSRGLAILVPGGWELTARGRKCAALIGGEAAIQQASGAAGVPTGIATNGGIPSWQNNSKIRILFLAANPKDTSALRLGEEVRSIQDRLRSSSLGATFEIAQEWAVRVSDLQTYLLRHQPHIVHFSGHGSQSGEIVLEDVTGAAKLVAPAALSRLFKAIRGNVRCVILNACFSKTQAKGIARSIDCVVGMDRSIGDGAAISFAYSFYQALGYGRSVKEAFDLGCAEISLQGLDDPRIPKLILRKGVNGESFHFGILADPQAGEAA
ncbi:MAG TPA: CHAT domain-containing protein [Tepidisphaeraceae bacterium]|nr:CHAT domain-containing protein [Tepidisphaeraceae bacterium]